MLWRRRLVAIVRLLAVQGVALAGAGRRARRRTSTTPSSVAVAVGSSCCKARCCCPWLVRRASGGDRGGRGRPSRSSTSPRRCSPPRCSTLLAFAVTRAAWSRSRRHRPPSAVPVGVAVVLIGFFVLVTRRKRALPAGRVPPARQRHRRRRVPRHRRGPARRRARRRPSTCCWPCSCCRC